MANYSFLTKKKLPDVPENKVFEDINFVQKTPHTKIYDGVKGLTFRKCNLNNCDLPEDAIEDDCGHIHVSYCSHEHPDWGLPECGVECEHLTNTDVIEIDDKVIETVYHYKDKAVI